MTGIGMVWEIRSVVGFSSFKFVTTPMKRYMRASTIKRMEQEYHNAQTELKGDVSQRKFSLEYHTRSNSCILYMKRDSGLQALLGQGLYHLFDICIVSGIGQPHNCGTMSFLYKNDNQYTISQILL